MLETRTSRRRRDGDGRRAVSPAGKMRDNWPVITDPYQLLLRRFTDRQFNIILSYLADTPVHLGGEGRFLAAARRAYPELTVR